MRAGALTGLVLLGVIAVALRMRLQRRLTGDSGFRPPQSSTEKLTAALLVAGVLLIVLAAVRVLFVPSLTAEYVEHPGLRLTGLALYFCGVCLVARGQFDMAEAWRIGVDTRERTRLVTNGSFRLVRNPIFSGALLALAGVVMMALGWMSVAGFALTVGGVELHVRLVEEPHLVRIHRQRFVEYASKVGRFVPGIGCVRPRL